MVDRFKQIEPKVLITSDYYFYNGKKINVIERLPEILKKIPSIKKVVIVDEDVDISNGDEVEWAVLTRSQPDRDYYIFTNRKGSSLDPTRYPDGTTSKIGIDATMPYNSDKNEFVNYR